MITEINLDFGNFKIFQNYVIGTMNEGVVFDELCQADIWNLFNSHFKDRNFGYISNRINSYSVDPIVYINNSERFAMIKAMAVVTKRKMQVLNVQLERQFFKTNIEVFENLEQGISWIEDVTSYTNSNSLSTLK